MKYALSLYLLLVSSVAAAQGPVSVEIEPTKFETTTETVKRTSVVVDGKKLGTTETTVDQSTREQNGFRIKTSEPAKSVLAFNTDFNPATILKVDDETHLLTGQPGKYLVIIETAKGSTIRPVFIEGTGQPDNGGDTDTAALAKLSAALAAELNDPPTREAIAVELEKALPAIESVDKFEQAEALGEMATEQAFVKRRGESQNVDWLNGWRRPLQKEMNESGVDTVPKYKAAIKSIIEGLEATETMRVPVEEPRPQPVSVLETPSPVYELRWVQVRQNCIGGRCLIRNEQRWVRVR